MRQRSIPSRPGVNPHADQVAASVLGARLGSYTPVLELVAATTTLAAVAMLLAQQAQQRTVRHQLS
jgi:hypothetical protein